MSQIETIDKQVIIDDFRTFKAIFTNFVSDLPSSAWALKTGERDKDWTVHETLSHLVSIAAGFNIAADAVLNDKPLELDLLPNREALRSMNSSEIERLINNPPHELLKQLWAHFDKTIAMLNEASQEKLNERKLLRVYGRPARMVDFIEWQLSHAGIIHAAQITSPVEVPPLWEGYGPNMTQRQLDRFIRQFSQAYWPEFGPDEDKRIYFVVQGESGGEWSMLASPNGSDFQRGKPEAFDYQATFDSAQSFFGIFTGYLPFMQALRKKNLMMDDSDTMRMMKLFNATPPRM